MAVTELTKGIKKMWKERKRKGDVPDYFIIVNKYHPTQTKRVKKIIT